jgi:hypothetical protein
LVTGKPDRAKATFLQLVEHHSAILSRKLVLAVADPLENRKHQLHQNMVPETCPVLGLPAEKI